MVITKLEIAMLSQHDDLTYSIELGLVLYHEIIKVNDLELVNLNLTFQIPELLYVSLLVLTFDPLS